MLGRLVSSQRNALFQRSQALQEGLGLGEMGKQLLFFTESGRMHHSPAASQFHWMPKMQHFVVDKIFNRIPRDARAVKDAADDDGVMGGIIVPKAA